ncbi:group II intron maturase-specific domain-containing protein [Desulfonema limicola]|uniref:group II intron maturase-specific domain-containing protein n=1 Tax=Desulfonema limicola TaxID=45656 RepID=UPI003B831AC4
MRRKGKLTGFQRRTFGTEEPYELNVSEWCRKNRHLKVTDLFKKLNAKLRGYYNYYGVIGNFESLSDFFWHTKKILFKWLNRRRNRFSFHCSTHCKAPKRIVLRNLVL